jgi:hypothetical protein
MSAYFNLDDDRLFDRLVDGELSDRERRELLQSLEAAPAGWRRCAMAFLEAQSWRQGMRRMVRGTAPGAPTAAPRTGTQPARRLSTRSMVASLALAAGLLLAVTLAVRQRGTEPGVNNIARSEEKPPATDIVPPDGLADGANDGRDNDALTFWVRDETGQQRRVRVPLMDADPMDRELGMAFQSGVPDELRTHLQGRGYDVQSRRRYAPLMLENGRRMIVPVEDTKIVPVSQNVY